MLFVKYDAGKKYLRGLDMEDMPDAVKQGLVAQFFGHVAQSIASATAARIEHTDAEILVPGAIGSYDLGPPFSVVPLVPGFYFVHHQRYERIYGPVGGYEVELLVESTATPEVAGYTPELGVAVSGPSYDIVKLQRGRVVYCNGTTDEILIKLQHGYVSSLTFGSLAGTNSRATTSIFFVGREPDHGELP